MTFSTRSAPLSRVSSIDILRGLIIILMALDHTRAYWGVTSFSPTDIEYTHWTWFFTRWITHFCAPLFVFLTGVSAFLYEQKVQDKTKLRNFLFTRGVWLVLLEILVITPSWQGNYDTVVWQVIWILGWSMIMLSVLIYLKPKWILSLCIPVLFLHNALNDADIIEKLSQFSWLWHILHSQGAIHFNNSDYSIYVAYPLIPWFGVMALGYVVGQVYIWSPPKRITYLTNLGLGFIVMFVLLRATGSYGDPSAFDAQYHGINAVMSFLNTHKYPPSLQYLLMTLGPGLVLLAQLEKITDTHSLFSRIAWLKTFGAVPLFFYVIHVPIINGLALAYTWLKYGQPINMLVEPSKLPPSYEPSLILTLCVWVLLLAVLYLPCKQYAALKRRSNNMILSYL
ncbi:DUF1624 domain-containing protein [Pseudoalteromonas sp. JBTF-M23]|uniref:DUF1624 domain-containing protein n=1 Tax=Pseudoalteromonas caenipelagi TaxID=2726988 RepID=A0A849VDP6_9GAMM|nr:heparan-alpha-glucosaminide N-acetyltransferase domain-containing protein [Pseudoalteromonas caenipelagi]NOU51416.1 DUF1624 domain-containing protein [Pseudoalteromonas caenipelagi]